MSKVKKKSGLYTVRKYMDIMVLADSPEHAEVVADDAVEEYGLETDEVEVTEVRCFADLGEGWDYSSIPYGVNPDQHTIRYFLEGMSAGKPKAAKPVEAPKGRVLLTDEQLTAAAGIYVKAADHSVDLVPFFADRFRDLDRMVQAMHEVRVTAKS